MTDLTDFPVQPNAKLAYEVLDTIKRHRSHFDMGNWARRLPGAPHIITLDSLTAPTSECGTVACFAGWTVALSGYDLNSASLMAIGADGGDAGSIPGLAFELLGLSDDGLFYVDDDEIEDAVEEYFGSDPRVPAEGSAP